MVLICQLTVHAAKSSVSMTVGVGSQVPLTVRRPGGKLLEEENEEEEKVEEEGENKTEEEEEEKEGNGKE